MSTITPEMTALNAAVRREFAAEYASGAISSWGIYNCRPKNNNPANGYSEHSWGNGEDYKILPEGGAAGDRLAAWARTSPLVAETFWKVYLHWDHIHLTASPRRNPDNRQIPPCAGGKVELVTFLPLREGDGIGDRAEKTDDVRLVQDMLNVAFGTDLDRDGRYGPATVAAVATHLGGEGKQVRAKAYESLLRRYVRTVGGSAGGITRDQADKRYLPKGAPIVARGWEPPA